MATETSRASAPSWVRYGGLVIVAAALLELVASLTIGVLFPEALVPGTRDAVVVADIVLTYLVLGLVGVAALYVYYRRSFGWIGNLGLLLIAVGIVVGVVTIVLTGSAAGSLLNMALVFGGAALLAVGLWRTPSAPRSATLLMAATPVAALVAIVGFALSPEGLLGPIAYLVLSLVWAGAWIVLGVHLWRARPGATPYTRSMHG